MTGPAFTCPDCGAVSHHPTDVARSYCGRCHMFKRCAVCGTGPTKIVDGICAACNDSLDNPFRQDER